MKKYLILCIFIFIIIAANCKSTVNASTFYGANYDKEGTCYYQKTSGILWWKTTKYYEADYYKRSNYLFIVNRAYLSDPYYWDGYDSPVLQMSISITKKVSISKTTSIQLTQSIGLSIPIEALKVSQSIGGTVNYGLTVTEEMIENFTVTLDRTSPEGYYQCIAQDKAYEYIVNTFLKENNKRSLYEYGKYMSKFITNVPYVKLDYKL